MIVTFGAPEILDYRDWESKQRKFIRERLPDQYYPTGSSFFTEFAERHP